VIPHTPGPWIVGPLFEIRALPIGRKARIVAQALMGAGITFEERAANAHLIAAAPDLLAALKNLVRKIERDNLSTTAGMGTAKARTAIAKAEGRP
jgi:hypothetical protein